MVAADGFDIYRIVRVCRLFDLGGVSGRSLFIRKLPFAILFAGNFRKFAAQHFWREAGVDSELASFFACAFNSLGSGGFSDDLLLLSRCVLQSILG